MSLSQAKLKQAIKALGIDVPILRAEAAGDGVRLYLYGHTKPVEWHPRSKTTRKRTTRKSGD